MSQLIDWFVDILNLVNAEQDAKNTITVLTEAPVKSDNW